MKRCLGKVCVALATLVMFTLPADVIKADVSASATKSQTSSSITASNITITVTVILKDVPYPPTVGYSADLYDRDLVFSDAVGVDATGNCSTWSEVATTASGQGWKQVISIPGPITVAASDTASSPDPYLEIQVTGPGGGTVRIATPGLPGFRDADVGADNFAYASNSNVLYGLPIRGFSRGFDQISGLDGPGVGLYFACDKSTQTLTGGLGAGDGQAFVLDGNGDLWEEEAYGLDYDPSLVALGQLRYLNINTAPDGVSPPTDQMYFVLEGSKSVQYTPNKDPSTATEFLNLSGHASESITALAVEDVGLRGLWDAGDSVLFAMENDSAIYKLSYGGAAGFLTARGVTFDGTANIDFAHLDDGAGPPIPSLMLGDVLSLSVAGSANPTPSDRFHLPFSVLLPTTPGDANGDGIVTDADYTIWADTYGSTTDFRADWNGSGDVTDADYTIWADNYTGTGIVAVPEPATLSLLVIGSLVVMHRKRK